MRRWMLVSAAAGTFAAVVAAGAQNPPRGYPLELYTWEEAEALLTPEAVVVIPLGAAAKEHGRHLKLRNDLTIAEYFTRRVVERTNVVVAPALTYHFYPAFVEYPGSTSLSLETARDLTVQVVRSLSRFGPRRFYVLNTGVSTTRPLEQAATALAEAGILMRFTDFGARADAAARPFRQQPDGSHADEIETSLMLHIAPETVDMKKAVREINPRSNPMRLTRRRDTDGTFSASGVWGDATLATAEKGAKIADALAASILGDIEALRLAMPPQPAAPRPAAVPARPGAQPGDLNPDNCSPGDLRRIMQMGNAYSFNWSNGDAEAFSRMWTALGDIVHPDGYIERTREIIFTNRVQLFSRREYRNSRHPLTLTMVRCLTPDIAVVDGRWNLIGVKDAGGKDLPMYEGQATLVVKRSGDGWLIEAYRYTQKAAAQPLPTWLKRPGWPDK